MREEKQGNDQKTCCERDPAEKFFPERIFGGRREKEQFRKQDREGKGEADLFGEHGGCCEKEGETIMSGVPKTCPEIHPERG